MTCRGMRCLCHLIPDTCHQISGVSSRETEKCLRGLSLRTTSFAIKRKVKGIWWMPWRQEAMKDVARCDKPGGEASAL